MQRSEVHRRSPEEVDDEIVEVAPFHVPDELLNGSELDRTSPYDRCILVLEQECHGDDLHTLMSDGGMDSAGLDVQSLACEPHHLRDIGAGDVDVEQTDLGTCLGE